MPHVFQDDLQQKMATYFIISKRRRRPNYDADPRPLLGFQYIQLALRNCSRSFFGGGLMALSAG